MNSNDTFCILPYIHHHIDVKGRTKLCCFAKSNSKLTSFGNAEYIKLRNEMLDGKKIKDCEYCWKTEAKNQVSHRQKLNAKYKDFETNIHNTDIITVDYRLTNHCNFACVMCNYNSSTKWAILDSIKTPVNEIEIDIATDNLKYVYLAGGEPLIVPKFKQFVKNIKNKDQTEIVINTNLSKLDDEWIDILSQFQTKCLTVSVDAYGKLCEYIRWPLDWKLFESNCNKARDNNIPLMFNTVLCNINYFDTLELLDWMTDYNPVTVGITECVDPIELNFDVLKKHHKNIFIEKTKEFLNHPLTKKNIVLQQFFLSQLAHADSFNQNVEVADTLHFLSLQDRKKNTSLSGVLCAFNNLFQS